MHICFGGPIQQIQDHEGKWWVFEMHQYCGPIVLRLTDLEPRVNQPPEKSPFWVCISQWAQQGEKVKKDKPYNVCQYDKEIPLK